MYEIAKTFSFDAAHRLYQMPEDHPCRRLHGHTYQVTLRLRSTRLNDKAMVRDYGELSEFGAWLKLVFDHRYLNEVLALPPTAENIAQFLYDHAIQYYPELYSVRVSETPKTWAEYREG